MTALLSLLAVGTSAALWWVGTGLHPLWWATWLAATPILWLAPRLSATQTLLAAALAWTLGALNLWHFFTASLGVPLPAAVVVTTLPALPFALAVIAWRGLLRRMAPLRAAFVFAAILTTVGFASQELSPHSTMGSLAYSQMDCLPVLQLAALAGVSGISFLLLFVPAAMLAAWLAPTAPRQRIAIVLSVLGLTTGLLAWGHGRLGNPMGSTIAVGLVASDRDLIPHEPATRQPLLEGYARAAHDLIASGAQLIVLPEKVAIAHTTDLAEMDGPLAAAADKGAIIVAGLHRIDGDVHLNEARLYGSGPVQPLLYEKHHLLPQYEGNMRPGTARLTLDRPSGRWGVAICKDLDFPALAREYSNDGIGLLVVPAWDFVADGWLHDRMAVLRGVESGFSIARAAKQGLLTLSDDRGRVLAETVTGAEDFTTLLGRVPVRHDETLYARWGDWFAWLVMAGLVLVGAGSFLRHRV